MIIPAVAVNSFFPRLKSLNISTTEIEEYLSNLNIHPNSIKIDKDSISTIYQCPSNLHLVLWNPSMTIDMNIYHETATGYFNPSYNTSTLLSQPPHHIIYTLPKSNAELPPHMKMTLSKNEYVFIPWNHMISITANSIDFSIINNLQINKMCFMDASNFKLVQKSLASQAKVSPAANALLYHISNPSFNTSMERDPKDLPLEIYQTFPRDNYLPPDNETKKDKSNLPKSKRTRGGGFRGNELTLR